MYNAKAVPHLSSKLAYLSAKSRNVRRTSTPCSPAHSFHRRPVPHMMRHMRPVSDASTNGSSDRLATVVEAAEILGITPDAVRSRLRRGTLKRSPERGEDGEVLVVLPSHKTADQSNDPSATVGDQPVDQSATDSDASATVALMEHMESEITHL